MQIFVQICCVSRIIENLRFVVVVVVKKKKKGTTSSDRKEINCTIKIIDSSF